AELRKVGNAFQSVVRTREQLLRLFGFEPAPSPLWDRLTAAFEKRHPITHNLGVIDRRYLEKAQRAEREGREIRITVVEIAALLGDVSEAIRILYSAPALGLVAEV